WQALPPATPLLLRRLLRSCLERDPRQRLHDAADARIVLDELLRGPSPEERTPAIVASRQRSLWWLAAALALGALLGGAAGSLARRPGPTPPAQRWLLAMPEGLALNAVNQPALALSRDGRLQVAAVVSESGTSQLLLRDSQELQPRLLPDTDGATSPF